MAKDCMLTTFDNPYNPFDDFTLWLMYDKEQGYDTCERLARIAKLSDDMSQDEIDAETVRAMDEIIFYDFLNIYKKVWQDSEPDTGTSEENK